MIRSRRVLWLVLWQTIILAIPGVSRLHKRAKTRKLNNWKTAKLKPIEGKLIKSVQQAGANICVACVFLSASCYVSSQKLCVLANKRISTEKCYGNRNMLENKNAAHRKNTITHSKPNLFPACFPNELIMISA